MLVLKTKYQKLSRLVFAPDGRGLAAAGQHGTYYWRSVFDGPAPERFGEKECGGVGFTPDGSYLIAMPLEANLSVIGLNAQSLHVVGSGVRYPTLSVCPATGLAVVAPQYFGGEMSGWRVAPDGTVGRAWVAAAGAGGLGSAAFAPDGSWFVRAARNPRPGVPFRLVLHDPASGHEIGACDGGEWVGCGPAVSPGGGLVAFGTGHHLRVRAGADPEWAAAVTNDSSHQYTGLAFHPSGRFLAATNNDRTVKLYDTATWQVAKTYTWDVGRMRSIAFSPDGTLAAAGSDTGKIVVWDVDV